MFDTNSITQNNHGKTKAISRIINLGSNLDLFISGSSKDSSFLDYLLNKILDYSIDSISKQNTYKDFSATLEHVNSVLKTWEDDSQLGKMNMVIGILNDRDFLFSNIGKSSCYLVKKNSVVEITDKKDRKKEFSFISNGELEHNDIIVMSSKRLLNFLSESDFIDSYSKKIQNFNNSVQLILDEEKIEKNISISSLIYKSPKTKKQNKKIDLAKTFFYKFLDTNIVKRIIALWLILKERLSEKGKLIKTILFTLGIILSIIFLFSIVGKTIQSNIKGEDTQIYSQYLDQAKVSLRKASESGSNKDIFEININETEELIKKIEEKGLFLNDIQKLKENAARIKKSFNGVESFDEDESKKISSSDKTETVKIIGVNKLLYVIGKNTVSGPIIEGKETKIYTFSELGDDSFIDATPLLSNIALITKKGKVVVFSKNGNFKFSDVTGQDKWEDSNMISSYNSNIYLVSKDENQIYKHKKSGDSFTKGTSYLKKEDQKTIGSILDIAIDGGFYILKKDLTFMKFFSSPRYRLESLSLNNAPDNYKIEDPSTPLKIKTRQDLNYVYMLLNNKIFVFKPNSNRYQDTKSLTYVGQIEGQKYQIIDFYIKHDGELMILNQSGIYKMNFEVNDGKLMVR